MFTNYLSLITRNCISCLFVQKYCITSKSCENLFFIWETFDDSIKEVWCLIVLQFRFAVKRVQNQFDQIPRRGMVGYLIWAQHCESQFLDRRSHVVCEWFCGEMKLTQFWFTSLFTQCNCKTTVSFQTELYTITNERASHIERQNVLHISFTFRKSLSLMLELDPGRYPLKLPARPVLKDVSGKHVWKHTKWMRRVKVQFNSSHHSYDSFHLLPLVSSWTSTSYTFLFKELLSLQLPTTVPNLNNKYTEVLSTIAVHSCPICKWNWRVDQAAVQY